MTGAVAAASLVCLAGCIACLAYLHVAPTGYSPLTNAVSQYGVGTYARWYQAQAAAAGLAAVGLAVALGRPRRVVLLLAVFAAARLAITRAPLDARPVAHWLLAALAFGAVTVAGVRLSASEHGAPALGWAMVASAALMAVARRTASPQRWFGLAERVFYAAMLAWFALVAVRLL